MSFRTVVITQRCKCSYKNDYMVVFGDETSMIHLSEINTVVFDTTAVTVTAYLLCELAKRKVNVIFCDEKHNPLLQALPLYGSHNASKRVSQQVEWSNETKRRAWRRVVAAKIRAQAENLYVLGRDGWDELLTFAEQVQDGDETNREGHAAKVYFNCLFGKQFYRGIEDSINDALNYGYMILISTVSKEIVAHGYLTQLGINHRSEYNQFNLSCDLVEPFRPFVDRLVYDESPAEFNWTMKEKLLGLLSEQYLFDGQRHYLSRIARLFVRDALSCVTENRPDAMRFLDITCEFDS